MKNALPIIIVGAGGFGLEICTFLKQDSRWDPVGFIDGNPKLKGVLLDGTPILGDDNDLVMVYSEGVRHAFVAIGSQFPRFEACGRCVSAGFELINVVHPTAFIALNVTMGTNVAVYPHATINAKACISDGVLVNSNVSIGHETVIGAYTNINPNAAVGGKVFVGKYSYIGIGSSILETRIIGERSIVGGGALVNRDVQSGTTVVGVPARPMK